MKKFLSFLCLILGSYSISLFAADLTSQDQNIITQDEIELKQNKATLQTSKDQLNDLKKTIQKQRQQVIQSTHKLEADENTLTRHKEELNKK